jgi:hypothetical protein
MFRRFVVVWLFGLLVAPARAETLWYLAFADTNDAEIGTALITDMRVMQELWQRLERETDLDVVVRAHEGRAFTADAVDKVIAEVRAAKPDVVLFYYTGHGTGSTSGDRLPDLAFPGRRVAFSSVVSRLREAQPRLLIALADACNNVATVAEYSVQGEARMPASRATASGLRALISTASGEFIAAAAARGEFAVAGDDGDPSVFTARFLEVFNREAAVGAPTWSAIRSSLVRPISVKLEGGTNVQTPEVSWRGR